MVSFDVFGSPVYTAQEIRELVEASGRIHFDAFQISLGVLNGLAMVCFTIRMIIRVVYQRKLHVDDYFLILAAACLIAATGIIYYDAYFLYLHTAALHEAQVLPYMISSYSALMKFHRLVYAYLALIWTTTWSVKACFLAFFRPLVWHMGRGMNIYFWSVVGFCAVSWAFVVVDPFILCPYFGDEAIKCFQSTTDGRLALSLTILVTILDVLSDIMIVAIPILVLKGSFLSRSTKFGLIGFLCLSIFMAICALIKIAGFKYEGLEDDTWSFYWQHAEGTIAVMMASITAFRTLFVRPPVNLNDDVTTPRSPVENFYQTLKRRFRILAKDEPEKPMSMRTGRGLLKMPRLPGPILTGVRTFIKGNGKREETNATVHSVWDPSEADYHAILKAPERTHGRSGGSAKDSPLWSLDLSEGSMKVSGREDTSV